MFIRTLNIIILILIVMTISGCKPSDNINKEQNTIDNTAKEKAILDQSSEKSYGSSEDEDIVLRFLEIGSDGCVPCKMMRPVMEKVEEKYSNVRVLFYEVYSDTGRVAAQTYKVRLIPTQVFLDNEDNVVSRHEGFYAYEDMAIFIDSFISENK